jgi:hypothetical protein
MTTETSATENAYIARAVEASINIGLVACSPPYVS